MSDQVSASIETAAHGRQDAALHRLQHFHYLADTRPATVTQALPTLQPTSAPKPIGAFESKRYSNLYTELPGKAVPDLFKKLRYTPVQP